jgi:hypothetical protein
MEAQQEPPDQGTHDPSQRCRGEPSASADPAHGEGEAHSHDEPGQAGQRLQAREGETRAKPSGGSEQGQDRPADAEPEAE